jgi:ssDNA-binding Zn-finger/Zn-ribbon topoisomerase 1
MSRSDWQKAFNKISSKHFDFLLCDKNDLSILCAIELNDRSHNSKKRKDRDIFLEGACQSANVPLVQIVAQTTYNIKEIQNALSVFLPRSMPPKSVNVTEPAVIERKPADSEKLCPKCSAVMVKKVAKKGKNAGNEFWACSAFPKCRYTEAINA